MVVKENPDREKKTISAKSIKVDVIIKLIKYSSKTFCKDDVYFYRFLDIAVRNLGRYWYLPAAAEYKHQRVKNQVKHLR